MQLVMEYGGGCGLMFCYFLCESGLLFLVLCSVRVFLVPLVLWLVVLWCYAWSFLLFSTVWYGWVACHSPSSVCAIGDGVW